MEYKDFTDLPTLFFAWEEAHKNDGNRENNFPQCPCCGNIPPDAFKGSFTPDGYLSDKTDIDILFIARESNVSEKIAAGGETDHTFWLKAADENKDSTARKYKSYIREIAEKMDSSYEQSAYMNINKRGGYSQCTKGRLSEYINDYKEYIMNEIRLINPKRIVFLGYDKKYGDALVGMIKDINKEIKCYSVYHPSAPNKKDAFRGLETEIEL